MKKLLLLFLCLISVFFIIRHPSENVKKVNQANFTQITQTPKQTTIFVPSWTIDNELADTDYDTFIYFGITPDQNGINTQDTGYKNIQNFLNNTNSSKKRLLTVSMIDNSFNSTVLNDKKLQQKIIGQADQIAEQNGFNGIVLDFETSALAFDSVTNDVTNFETSFAKQTKNNNLLFYSTLYGDNFYRIRPYDTEKIANAVDGVYIMAYDFHKANGQPGPNFPLFGKDTYGYDLQTMLADFEKHIPKEKITVVFGMFGYDWTLDKSGQSSTTAKSLSNNKIEQNCVKNCKQTVDKLSTETKITYTDSKNQNHVIWFETQDSTNKKQSYLQQQGINSTGFWAYSYF